MSSWSGLSNTIPSAYVLHTVGTCGSLPTMHTGYEQLHTISRRRSYYSHKEYRVPEVLNSGADPLGDLWLLVAPHYVCLLGRPSGLGYYPFGVPDP